MTQEKRECVQGAHPYRRTIWHEKVTLKLCGLAITPPGAQCRNLWNTPPRPCTRTYSSRAGQSRKKKKVEAMLHRSASSEKIFNIATNTDSSELCRLWVNVAGPWEHNVGSKKQFTRTDAEHDFIYIKIRDIPGGPVAKTPCFRGRGPGFDPWSGNKIPHAARKIKDPVRHNKDLAQPKRKKIKHWQSHTTCYLGVPMDVSKLLK